MLEETDGQRMVREAREILDANYSETDEAFTIMHQMYLQIRAGGFTEYQALWLIGYVISNGSVPPEDRISE